MEYLIGAFVGWLFIRVVASLTYGSKEGSVANRINVAIVGPWRPKKQ